MNQNNIQQFLLFKYFIETIQKQQNTKSNDVLKESFHQSIQQNQEHPINISPTLTNSISSKKDYQSEGSDINHDDAYWERRRKNNEAAKRSRNARRVKEDEIALRAALLEQENVKLRLENVHLKQENIKLRYQISTSTDST